MSIELDRLLCRAVGSISTEVDGETVILDVDSGRYVGLDAIGTRIWRLLENEISLQNLLDSLAAEYDVERQQCIQDVQEFLEELSRSSLIVVH